LNLGLFRKRLFKTRRDAEMIESGENKIIIKEKEKPSLKWLRNLIITLLIVFLIYKIIPAIQNIIILFTIAILFAYLLEPVISRIENKGLPRIITILFIYIIIGFLFYFIGQFVIPYIVNEVADLIASLESKKIETTYQNILSLFKDQFPFVPIERFPIDDLLISFKNFLLQLSRHSLSFIQQAFSLFTYVVMIPFIALFILKDGAKIKRRLIHVIPNKYFEMSLNLIHKIDIQIGNYIRGQTLDAIILAILTSTGLYLLDIKYAIFIGTFAGIANLIPYLGPIIGGTPAVIISIMEYQSFEKVPWVILLFVIIQISDNVLFQPTVVAKSIDVHPLIVIFSVFAGGQLFGVIGMLFAVPFVAILKVGIYEVLWSIKNFKFE